MDGSLRERGVLTVLASITKQSDATQKAETNVLCKVILILCVDLKRS
jgi:hypothetical protein